MSAKTSPGAANQSRRRDTIKDEQPDDGGDPVPPTFSYRGLELDEEAASNLRLVSIEPPATAAEDDMMVCTLSVKLFKDMPQFEALSYMWGPETPPDERLEILLNGVRFPVRANLLGALRYLRGEIGSSSSGSAGAATTRLFWIDAICINQEDIEERNRQVPRMRHIYFRASTVVVWLGADYVKIQDRIPEFGKAPSSAESSDAYPKEESEMVLALQKDAYWGRVWILQEIGRARRLRVCFGRVCLPWTNFIHLLTLHHCDNNGSGPLWLDLKLRVERQPGSRALKQLLKDHQKADCSEPRDKVYGLLGLASDAARFPVDYKKSLMTIWEDTMVFLNAHGLIGESLEIIQTGQLVKHLLASGAPSPLAQSMPRIDRPPVGGSTGNGRLFRLEAAYLGSVVDLGPSVADFVANLSVVEAWDSTVHDGFEDSERGEAYWENDLLQDSLLNHSPEILRRTCFNQTSSTTWIPPSDSPAHDSVDWNIVARAGSEIPAAEDPDPETVSTGQVKAPEQSDPRLILLKNRPWEGEFKTARKMGIASGSVLEGDLLYWVKPCYTSLLIRSGYSQTRVIRSGDSQFPETQAQIVGTALVTEDLMLLNEAGRLGNRPTTYYPICADAMTIFTMLE
ncbi:hypothetical protein MAPG_11082 [Magnaporthiopsis poae ATCC 64411]|uniref:Heterokaryon incompatibility domain-containing protein n=1 Tax=Magnaporthiopsis poae (strain ATCC 64411 / 73-15) TaxID=644358 RepID=A0A0C4EEB1_MAGP6|nr:hypothetical protein MAPG_11082 [Magnaporthiopsis poae ATCC 64411]